MQKKDAQSIGEIIDKVLKEQNLDLKLDETRLVKAWNSLLGEHVASYTNKLFIQKGVLYVQLSSSVLRSELCMCRNMLIDRLNKQVGRQVITDIVFR
ncbi:DciA family protein [Coprobacter sp.]